MVSLTVCRQQRYSSTLNILKQVHFVILVTDCLSPESCQKKIIDHIETHENTFKDLLFKTFQFNDSLSHYLNFMSFYKRLTVKSEGEGILYFQE